jgi:hypothetical protein
MSSSKASKASRSFKFKERTPSQTASSYEEMLFKKNQRGLIPIWNVKQLDNSWKEHKARNAREKKAAIDRSSLAIDSDRSSDSEGKLGLKTFDDKNTRQKTFDTNSKKSSRTKLFDRDRTLKAGGTRRKTTKKYKWW